METYRPADLASRPAPEAVREQAQRITASHCFRKAERLSRFLVFILDTELAGRGDELKEYLIATEVFGRTDYDPSIDSVVRVEASKLRSRLTQYYETEGRGDDIRIEIPKGAYVPVYQVRQRPPILGEPRPANRRRWLWAAGGLAILAAAGFGTFLFVGKPEPYGPRPSKIREANEYVKLAEQVLLTQLDLPRVRQLLEKALELDPEFGHARALYGFAHVLEIDMGHSNDTTWLYRAEQELQRALKNDPNWARTHAFLAHVYFYQGRKELMQGRLAKALELDPNHLEGLTSWAIYHQMNGDYEQSQALIERTLAADPLFFPARWNYGENLRQMGDPAGSIREQNRILEHDPKNTWALANIALAHITAGDVRQARSALERVRELDAKNYAFRLLWAVLLALEGKKEEALLELDGEVLKYAEMINYSSWVAEFYAVSGDTSKALDWLDRAVRSGDERAPWFERDPLLMNIRKEPRFRQIVDSIRKRRQQN